MAFDGIWTSEILGLFGWETTGTPRTIFGAADRNLSVEIYGNLRGTLSWELRTDPTNRTRR